MKLFPPDTFLVYKIPLKGDIVLLSYWDLDDRGRPSLLCQFIRIGKGDLLPLKTPILDFRPPVINGIYDKREFSHLLEREVERKRPYLDRAGNVLIRQLESIILTDNPYYITKPKKETEDDTLIKAFRRFVLITAFIFGNGGEDGKDEKKKPP